MLTFAHPLVLILLPLAVILALAWLRRPRPALWHPSAYILSALPIGRSKYASILGAAMRWIGFTALVVALAAPRLVDPGSRISTRGIALYVVLDVSGSMAERDYVWDGKSISRLEAARRVLLLLLNGGKDGSGEDFAGRTNDLVGLVFCSTYPEIACPLTLDHPALVQAIERAEPRRLPTESQTNLGDSVALAAGHLMQSSPAKKAVIVLTDGEHNVPAPALTPKAATALTAALGIPIYTIDLGSNDSQSAQEGPGTEKVDKVRAHAALADMAKATGGKYFLARDSAALAQACAEIDALEKDPLPTPLYRKYQEVTAWFAVAGVATFGLLWFLETLVWPTYP